MPNPLDALRKAQTIGPDSWQEMLDAGGQEMAGQGMPVFPPGKMAARLATGALDAAPAGWGQAVKGLLGWGEQSAPGASSHALGASSAMSHPVQETLGEHLPYYTPVGGEAFYNTAKQVAKPITDPLEAAYERIKAMRGR